MVGLMAILMIWAFSQRIEAENQKVLALASKEVAEFARDDAIKQKDRQQANQRANKENYYNQIALANAKFQDGDFDSAQTLWATDPKFRHWEWGRLLSLTTIPFGFTEQFNPSKIEITDDEKYAVVTTTGDKINIIELGNPNISRAISIHQQMLTNAWQNPQKTICLQRLAPVVKFVFGSVQAVRFFINLLGTLKDFKL